MLKFGCDSGALTGARLIVPPGRAHRVYHLTLTVPAWGFGTSMFSLFLFSLFLCSSIFGVETSTPSFTCVTIQLQ